MASIERTAYPRFASGRTLKKRELEQFYSLTPDELRYLNANIRGTNMRLNFAVQLKTFQRLGYFIELKNVPSAIIEYIKKWLGYHDIHMTLHYDHDDTKYRHRERICSYLKINRWKRNKKHVTGMPIHPGRHLAIQFAYQSAQTMNNPADIINVVIEELIHHQYELPPFSQLNDLVKRTRSLVNRKIFKQVYQQLDVSLLNKLDDLLLAKSSNGRTGYNSLKRIPKNPTITHFKELLEHHHWLMSFGSIDNYLLGIPKIKLQQFSAEAKSLDASDFRDMSLHRRYSLIIFLIDHAQRHAKDALAIMYCRTMAKMHKKAEEKLALLREQQSEKTRRLLGAFYDVLLVCKEDTLPEVMGGNVLRTISEHGGVNTCIVNARKL